MLNNVFRHLGLSRGLLVVSAFTAAFFTITDIGFAESDFISAFLANTWKVAFLTLMLVAFAYYETPRRGGGGRNLDIRNIKSAGIDNLQRIEQTLRAREQELDQLKKDLANETAQRTRAEDAGREVGRDLEAMLSNIPVLVLMMDPVGRVLFTNGYWIRDGYKDSESLISQLNTDPSVFHHPEDYVKMLERRQSSISEGSNYYLEHRVRRPDGSYRWFLTRTTVTKDDNGNVVRRYLTSIDIDDRKKTEEALGTRERELQLLIDTVPTPIWSLTPDGYPSYLNKRFEAEFGPIIRDVEFSTMDRNEVHPDEQQAVSETLSHSLRTGEPYAIRYRRRTAGGMYRWVDVRAQPLRDDAGSILRWYGSTIDIDDETRARDALNAARDRLSRATQLATISELSASIAHELNQPLAATVAGSEASQRWLLAEPPNIERARSTLERVVRNARSAADVVGRIHALFAQEPVPQASIDLNEVIEEVLILMNDLVISEGVLLDTRLGVLPTITADGVQIQQVMVNLIRNAIDAMKPLMDQPKPLLITSRPLDEGGALVEVRDEGEGISDPDRIFEAFFTTKQQGKGLGLAICRSIIDAHGGRLWAERAGGRGTVVRFTLPSSGSSESVEWTGRSRSDSSS
ncbi:PAS domain-containing sensor histidine kinase (plasmid) [Sinorhizobium sp. B11]